MWVDQANGILLGIVLALKAIAINVKLPLGQLLGKYIRWVSLIWILTETVFKIYKFWIPWYMS